MESVEMEFQDREISCSDCGSDFVFSADEQQFYQEKGLTHEPKRCKPCRSERKARSRRSPQGRNDENRGNRRDDQPGNQRFNSRQAAGRADSRHPNRAAPGGPRTRAGSWDTVGGAPLFKADFGPSPYSQGKPRQRNQRGGTGATRRFDATCSDCGGQAQVPFRPNGVQPVYCRTCLPQHKSRRARGQQRHNKGDNLAH